MHRTFLAALLGIPVWAAIIAAAIFLPPFALISIVTLVGAVCVAFMVARDVLTAPRYPTEPSTRRNLNS